MAKAVRGYFTGNNTKKKGFSYAKHPFKVFLGFEAQSFFQHNHGFSLIRFDKKEEDPFLSQKTTLW